MITILGQHQPTDQARRVCERIQQRFDESDHPLHQSAQVIYRDGAVQVRTVMTFHEQLRFPVPEFSIDEELKYADAIANSASYKLQQMALGREL